MHVQRAIEAIGIPTILITVDPAQTLQARPPRAVHPLERAIGTPVGRAEDVAGQRDIIVRALQAVLDPIEPGSIRELE